MINVTSILSSPKARLGIYCMTNVLHYTLPKSISISRILLFQLYILIYFFVVVAEIGLSVKSRNLGGAEIVSDTRISC